MLFFDVMISFCIRLLRSIFLCFFATLFCWAASPAQGQSASSRSAAEGPIWQRNNPQFEALPLELSPQNHLIVRAYINGQPAALGVDTGAPVSAICANRRQHYGFKAISGDSRIPAKLVVNGVLDSVGVVKSLRIGAINGAPARLMLDTGAAATLLHRSFITRMKIPLRDTPFTSAAVNLKVRDVQVARIRRLTVGSVDIVGHNVGVIDLAGLIHGGL